MAIFLVALTEPSEEIQERINKFWGADSFSISNTLTLISPRVSSAGAISQKIGIEIGDNKPAGLVLEITNNLSGVLFSDAVNWINEARQS
ncbi:MAG: hypothetical protein OXC80_01570 [Gammaproteobacteria bacterium]|nr:hypothetical protein [Gammaproteobacteria bacterium]